MKISSSPGYQLTILKPAEGPGKYPLREGRRGDEEEKSLSPASRIHRAYSQDTAYYDNSGRAIMLRPDGMEIIPAGYFQRGIIVNTWA